MNQSIVLVEWLHGGSAAGEENLWPRNSGDRSGRYGFCVSLKRSWPVTLSCSLGRNWKSGPKTRLWPPPPSDEYSRSVKRKLPKLLPRSCRTRATAAKEERSWSTKPEDVGPGRITLPPPRSSA